MKNLILAFTLSLFIFNVSGQNHIELVCGTGQAGFKDGKPGSGLSELNKPAAVLVHAGYIWVADLNNHQIKIIPLH